MYHQNDYLIRQQVSNDCFICLYYFRHYFRFHCADVAYKQLALLWLLREGSTEVSSLGQSLIHTWSRIFNLTIQMLQTRKSGRKRTSRKWQWEEWKWETGKCLLCSPFLGSHWSLYVIFNKGWIDIILYLTPWRVYVTSIRVISPLLSDSLQLTEA